MFKVFAFFIYLRSMLRALPLIIILGLGVTLAMEMGWLKPEEKTPVIQQTPVIQGDW